MQDMSDVMQHVLQSLSDMPQSEADVEAFMKPDPVNKAAIKEVKRLPLADEVWFSDFKVYNTEENSEITLTVRLVEKEHNSNRHILPDCNGLGFSLGHCCVRQPLSFDTSELSLLLVGTIIKTCRQPGFCSPGLINMQPHRPKKLLFRSAGMMNSAWKHIRKFGDVQAEVADAALVQSVQSHLNLQEMQSTHVLNRLGSEDAGSRNTLQIHLEQSINGPYVDENEQSSLASWTNVREEIGATPLEWFVKPPPRTDVYRLNLLWGWRSNLEIACKIGDIQKIEETINSHEANDIRSFCEQRVLLNNAAQNGLLNVCEALLMLCHCHPDGVQSPNNKVEWEEVQSESGALHGYTPLHFASREGHTAIVKLLVKKGARLDLVATAGTKGTALHMAAFAGNQNICKILCRAGADRTVKDAGGNSAIMTARSVLLSPENASKLHLSSIVEIGKVNVLEKICGTCGAREAKMRCLCGIEVYCGKQCQRAIWGVHKKEHKMYLDEKET